MNSKRKARVDRPRAGQLGTTRTNLLFPFTMVHRLSKKEHFNTNTKHKHITVITTFVQTKTKPP